MLDVDNSSIGWIFPFHCHIPYCNILKLILNQDEARLIALFTRKILIEIIRRDAYCVAHNNQMKCTVVNYHKTL